MVDVNAEADAPVSHRNIEIRGSRYEEPEDCCGFIGQWPEITTSKENALSDVPGQVTGKNGDPPHNEVSHGDPAFGGQDVSMNYEQLAMGITMVSEVLPLNEQRASTTPAFSPGGEDDNLASFLREESKRTSNPSLPLMEKLESTAENDIRTLNNENICHVAADSAASGSSSEVKSISIQDADIQHKGKLVSSNRRIHGSRKKGKEKELSDGDASGRLIKEDDNSNESVESCNSAGLFSVGRKRGSIEAHLIGENKQARYVQSQTASSSFAGQESSFMNWISNMVKGLPKTNQDVAGSLSLALTGPSSGNEHLDDSFVAGSQNLHANGGNMGFKSIFQSIYCSNKTAQESRTLLLPSQVGEGSTKIELPNKICAKDVHPLACLAEHDNPSKKLLLQCKMFDESTSEIGAGGQNITQVLDARVTVSHENCENHSTKSRNLDNLDSGRNKNSKNSSNSSLGGQNSKNADKDHSSSSEEKISNLGCRNDSPGSLWISRFSSRTSCSIQKEDICVHSMGGTIEDSGNFMRITAQAKQSFGCDPDPTNIEFKDCNDEEPSNGVGKRPLDCAAGVETSFGFRKLQNSHDHHMIHKVNRLSSSQRLKSSEEMASLFARRLDALKHIIPPNPLDVGAGCSATCLFCGIKGHGLRKCSEIAEAEQENLLRNAKSYQVVQEMPLCIRCYQPNHWAVTCPNVVAKSMPPQDCTYVIDHRCSDIAQLQNKQMYQKSNLVDSCNGNLKSKEVSSSDKDIPNPSWIWKCSALSPIQSRLKENAITTTRNFEEQHISDVPKAIFDLIKMLQLSRTSILKWMSVRTSPVHLDGFFLRLRLGKWEEGLGGTGYYVACITGMEREKTSGRNPISVNIGRVNCLVESQYISNHDFLEDELMAWLRMTSRAGGKIPTEEDLRMKVEEKKRLGF
ncbi:Plus3 domain-containing protein [Psidium guajava]|nr:Plus3 domain-containing protein [Psidium guajava]